jgi:DNA mismatch repair protein MSH4
VKTLLHLSLHPPSVIIAPDTFFATQKDGRTKSVLLEHIQEELPHVPLLQYPRRFWNDRGGENSEYTDMQLLLTPVSPGLEFVTQLSTEDGERAALLLTIHDRYYALQAVCAVFRYIESTFSTIYPPHTLVIRYRPIEGERQVLRSFKAFTRYSPGSMLIDTETARNLELLEGVSKQKTHSLFGSVRQFSPPLFHGLMLDDIGSSIAPSRHRVPDFYAPPSSAL